MPQGLGSSPRLSDLRQATASLDLSFRLYGENFSITILTTKSFK